MSKDNSRNQAHRENMRRTGLNENHLREMDRQHDTNHRAEHVQARTKRK